MEVQDSNSQVVFYSDSCSEQHQEHQLQNTSRVQKLKRQYQEPQSIGKIETKKEVRVKHIKKAKNTKKKCQTFFLQNYVNIQEQLIKRYRVRFDKKIEQIQFHHYNLSDYLQKLVQQSKACLQSVLAKSSQIQKTNHQKIVYQCKFCEEKFNKACALGGHIASLHSQKRRSLRIRAQKNTVQQTVEDKFSPKNIKQQEIFEQSIPKQQNITIKYQYKTPEKKKHVQKIARISITNINPIYTPPIKKTNKRKIVGTK